MSRIHSALAAIAVVAATHAAAAGEIPVPERVFFPEPETAVERFRWYGESNNFSISILGTEAVRARIQVGQRSTDAEFGAVIPMQVIGSTVGFFHTVYPINNQSLTLLDLEDGLLPTFTDSDFNERDYVTRLVVRYERDDYVHRILRIRPNQPNVEEMSSAPGDVYDDMSMIYDIRSRPLELGDGYVYYTHDGEEFARITIAITAIEDVFSEYLGYVQAAKMEWVIEPLESTPLLPFGGVALPPTMRPAGEPYAVATSWFTTDERRLIVGADIETSVGMMRIRLTDYTPPSTP